MSGKQSHPSDEVSLVPAKYVFLDVVDFSYNRSVEAQSYIVQALNRIVLLSLRKNSIPVEKRILLPTGDGICIALLNITEPYDIHIQLALSIVKYINRFQGSSLKDITDRNADQPPAEPVYVAGNPNNLGDLQIMMRYFQVRIGIEANIDNLIKDINERPNIAGAGINMAQRVMGLADGNQILVSQSVANELRRA